MGRCSPKLRQLFSSATQTVQLLIIFSSILQPSHSIINLGLISLRLNSAVDMATVSVAIDDAISNGYITNRNISIHVRPVLICDGKNGSNAAIDLMLKKNVDAILGYVCSQNCLSISLATSYWNLPFLPTFCFDASLDDKRTYNTLIRVVGSATRFGDAFSYLFDEYGWKRVVIVSDVSTSFCTFGINAIVSKFQSRNNMTIAEWIQLSNSATDSELTNSLIRISQRGRIVIFCHSTGTIALRNFMWKAQDFHMTNGDYAFFTLWSVPNSTCYTPWMGVSFPSDVMEYRQKAFKALKQITFKSYEGDSAVVFETQVYDKLWQLYQMNASSAGPLSSLNVFLHDATLLYLATATQLIADGLDYRNATLMRLRVSQMNKIDGVSGYLQMDGNGEGHQLFIVWTYTENSTAYIPYLEINTYTKQSFQLADTGWGDYINPPPDTPQCGFTNELCPQANTSQQNNIIIGCVLTCFVLLTSLASVALFRIKRTDMQVKQMAWKIDYKDLEFIKSRNLKASSTWVVQSHVSVAGSCPSFASFSTIANQRGSTDPLIAIYKGFPVSVHRSPRAEINLTKDDLVELFNMKSLVHDNIKNFIGACIEPGFICYIMQICNRGSLQEILADDDIQLDWTFKLSLLSDLVSGMMYLHKSPFQSHGRLTSQNCRVDNRWVLKISGFGLDAFRHRETSAKSGDERYRDLLWTAPELLRMKRAPANGTQEGDSFSFAIILYEIVYRSFPYASSNFNYKDIIAKVMMTPESSLFRPTMEQDGKIQVDPKILTLMGRCWAELPRDRLSFDEIEKSLRRINNGKKTNIVDSMLQKLERYANNLESIIEQRTGELMEEKLKTDLLLHRMLPPFIADELKAGRMVAPRVYNSATVYFSDIVGFTNLSSESTPIQIVDLLNDLYGSFDDTISKHDVYKVETIGDAYMVVSGLPKANHRHVVEISNMALDLLNVVKTFKIRHRPDKMLMLRIGIHSGPCAAGVVGHTMPRYCLFGDTVNVASRMESTGQALMIHLSSDAQAELAQFPGYVTQLRGEMNVKGKGTMTTYWLLGKSVPLTIDSSVSTEISRRSEV